MRTASTFRIGAVAICAMLVATACSSSGGGKSTAASNNGCPKPATGPAVKVMSIVEESQAANVFNPSLRAGLDAAAHAINCNGGLGASGNRVSITYCPTKLDPSVVAACDRQLINGGYIAAVGDNTQTGNTPELLASANIANIPALPLDAGAFTAKTTFAVDSGGLITAGSAIVACNAGHTHINEIRLAVPFTIQGTKLQNQGLKSYGCPPIAKSVDMPTGATDVTTQVSTASAGADAVTLDMAGQQVAQVVKATGSLGSKTLYSTAGITLTADVLRTIAGMSDGMLVASLFPTGASSGESRLIAALASIKKSDQLDDFARAGWVTMDLLATASRNLKTVDRASLLNALNTTTSYNAGGLTPTLDFSKPGPLAGFPRIVNPNTSPGLVKGGKVVPLPGRPTFEQVIKS